MDTDTHNILSRDLAGEPIDPRDPDFDQIYTIIEQAQRLTARLNTGYHEPDEVRAIMSELTGQDFPQTARILPPFYVDFGRNIRVGNNFFMNTACTFMDRGGITIGDDVFIGPKVCLVTINHLLDPYNRRITICKPIVIKDRVWIGANATVCPGVTIGENSVIAAGAVVVKDIPPNVIAAGNPARVIRELNIHEEKGD